MKFDPRSPYTALPLLPPPVELESKGVRKKCVGAGIAQRQTAAEYLQELEEIGILESRKVGREKIFLHPALLKLLAGP